jgi:ribonucleoside-diphosphate reductase alpha chain
MSNVSYCAKLICTNPCGEIWLSEYDCCCLGAVVLPRFVHNGDIQWDELEETVRLGVRFLDDVLTVNTYPLPEIKDVCSSLRRIGLGVMGLHDMLLMLGMKYTTDRALEKVDEVMAFIKNIAYEASIELAKEKGPFPKFRAEEFLKGGFAKTLKPSLRTKIAEHGIRNCALLTIAPTGTTSMVQNVTSGIEPMFAPAYRRKFQDGDELREEVVVHPLFQQYVAEGRSVKHFQGAYQLKLRDHFEMQRICQKHLDNACSKTINVLPGTSAEELSDLYMEFLPELKGVTVYPEGSREDQPLTPLSIEEALEYAQTASAEVEGGNCRSGSCEI